MTMLGQDADAENIKKQSEHTFISFELTETILDQSTGSYSAVLRSIKVN